MKPKIFESRESANRGYLYGVCRCGHMWCDHERGILSFIGLGGCNDCKCQFYVRYGRMNYDEKEEFRRKIDNERQKLTEVAK